LEDRDGEWEEELLLVDKEMGMAVIRLMCQGMEEGK
jgi:hypothetical protein